MRSMRAAVPARARGGPRRGGTGAAGAKAKTPAKAQRIRRRHRRAHLPVARPGPRRPHRACARPRDAEDRERQAGRGRDHAEGRPPPDVGRLARRQVRHPHGSAAAGPRKEDRPRARKAGDPPAGPTYASPPETAMRVLTLQHDVSSADGRADRRCPRHRPRRARHDAQPRNDRRDQALAYILSVAPPLPPEEDLARVRARKSQEEDAGADVRHRDAEPRPADRRRAAGDRGHARADATDLTAGGRRLLNAAETQVGKTKAFVSLNWPHRPRRGLSRHRLTGAAGFMPAARRWPSAEHHERVAPRAPRR